MASPSTDEEMEESEVASPASPPPAPFVSTWSTALVKRDTLPDGRDEWTEDLMPYAPRSARATSNGWWIAHTHVIGGPWVIRLDGRLREGYMAALASPSDAIFGRVAAHYAVVVVPTTAYELPNTPPEYLQVTIAQASEARAAVVADTLVIMLQAAAILQRESRP